MSLEIALIGGIFFASPICFYQLWAFISAGLKPKEKRWVYIFSPLSLGLFLAGFFFAAFVAIPFAIRFLLGFSSMNLEPMISLGRYLSFWGVIVFLFGLVFQIPLVIVFLCRIGIFSPKQIAKERKVVVLLIFIIAAILTPPDVVSQLLMAIPMWILFELGLLLARIGGSGTQ